MESECGHGFKAPRYRLQEGLASALPTSHQQAKELKVQQGDQLSLQRDLGALAADFWERHLTTRIPPSEWGLRSRAACPEAGQVLAGTGASSPVALVKDSGRGSSD